MTYIIDRRSKRKNNFRKDKRRCIHYDTQNKICKYLNKTCSGASKCLAYYAYK